MKLRSTGGRPRAGASLAAADPAAESDTATLSREVARLRRAQLAVVVLATLATIGLVLPGASRSVVAPDARLALEVLGLCAALFAAVILALPGEADVRPARNALVCGLAVLAISNAVFTVWPAIRDTRLPLDQGLGYYPWLAARYVAGVLFIAAGTEWPRLRLATYLAAALALLATVDLFLVALPGDLPVPVEVVGVGDDRHVRIVSVPTHVALQAIPAGQFALGAWLAGRLHVRSTAPAYLWLSVALLVQVFAQLHETFAPAFLGPVVTSADAFRLVAFLLLLLGAVHQLAYLYRNRSLAVRTQQRDLRAREELVDELRDFAEREHDFRTLVSHELATPVATIRAFAHVLGSRLDASSPPDLRRAVAGIDSESRRLLELVDRMDELRDLELSAFHCDLRPVMLRPVLEDAAAFVRGLPGTHPVMLRTTDARVAADPLRLGQALRNVLVNAVRYSPDGTSISIAAIHRGERVGIAITDRGPGIPPAERRRVRRRYARGSTARGTEGRGLGLYLATRIAETHGSTLVIEDGPDGGTRVTFELEVLR
ncbi:MAG: HAMP domain-containing histidine kinase [Actinobacteria bacterium]|nr:HAMP domain-containing histidine kinase [Actinomycetota bacterium]